MTTKIESHSPETAARANPPAPAGFLLPPESILAVQWASDGRTRFPQIAFDSAANTLSAQFSCTTQAIDQGIVEALRQEHLGEPIREATKASLKGSTAALRHREFLRSELEIEGRLNAAKAKVEAKRAEMAWVKAEAANGTFAPSEAATRLVEIEAEMEAAQHDYDQAAAELRQLAPLRQDAEKRWHEERDSASKKIAAEALPALAKQVKERISELEATDWLAAARSALAELAVLRAFLESLNKDQGRLGRAGWPTHLLAKDVAAEDTNDPAEVVSASK